jgi:hypothetical protein
LKYFPQQNSQDLDGNNFEYVVCLIGNNMAFEKIEDYLQTTTKIIGSKSIKTVVVLPFKNEVEKLDKTEVLLNSLSSNDKTKPTLLFSGEIVDDVVSAKEDDVVGIINSATKNNTIKITDKGKYHYPITSDILVDQVVYSLFSFGSQDKRIAVVAKPINEGYLCELLKVNTLIWK